MHSPGVPRSSAHSHVVMHQLTFTRLIALKVPKPLTGILYPEEWLGAFQKRKQDLILALGCNAPCQHHARSEQTLCCEAIDGHDSPEPQIAVFIELEHRLYKLTGSKSAP